MPNNCQCVTVPDGYKTLLAKVSAVSDYHHIVADEASGIVAAIGNEIDSFEYATLKKLVVDYPNIKSTYYDDPLSWGYNDSMTRAAREIIDGYIRLYESQPSKAQPQPCGER